MRIYPLFFLALATASAYAGPGLPVPPSILPHLQDGTYLVPEDFDTAQELLDLVNRDSLPGGKKVRPLLCFLSAGILGRPPHEVKELACIAEYAHQASLMHDDVIDASTTRRGAPSLWAQTTPTTAVLTGDFLILQAIRMANRLNRDHVESISTTVQAMTKGEVLQNSAKKAGNYSATEWAQVANYKTGALFSWALAAPSVHFGIDDGIPKLFQELGQTMGLMFQARDDLQDSFAERGEMNLVLMVASRTGGDKSPYDSSFSEESLAQARKAVFQTLEYQQKNAQSLIAELVGKIRSWNRMHQCNKPNCELQVSCEKALIDLSVLLGAPEGK